MSTVLWVHAKGGPSPSYALSRLARLGPVHVLAVAPLPDSLMAPPAGVDVTDVSAEGLIGELLVDRIAETARATGVDAIVTFSEFAVLAVAEASRRLGLRGAGRNAVRSRDKVAMRRTWRDAGLPGPRFQAVAGPGDLRRAAETLRMPFLLKAAWGAGSVAQLVVADRADLDGVWRQASAAWEAATEQRIRELSGQGTTTPFIAEEIIPGTVESWYDSARYGDYLSVEGVVVEGTYHPVCVTARVPTIAPFTELSNLAPCVLSEAQQRRIEDVARRAVDALQLETCGTHTELKLLADGGVALLESAARLGGAMVIREVESVHGVDLIGSLVRALRGEDTGLPGRMLVGGSSRAAASVALLAADSSGRPWSSLPDFDPQRVTWAELISPSSRAEVIPDLTIPAGSPMPPYDPDRGALNFAGLLFLEAPDPQTLLDDTYRLLDGLHDVLAGS